MSAVDAVKRAEEACKSNSGLSAGIDHISKQSLSASGGMQVYKSQDQNTTAAIAVSGRQNFGGGKPQVGLGVTFRWRF